jgi:hypothetical protein
MLFGTKKQNTLTEMDYLLRDLEGVFPIKAYSSFKGPWGKNTRKINYLHSIGMVVTRDNKISLFGKKPGNDMIYVNGMYNERDGRSYLYFIEHNRLAIIRKGYLEDTKEPSFSLANMQTFLSYVNNLSAVRK